MRDHMNEPTHFVGNAQDALWLWREFRNYGFVLNRVGRWPTLKVYLDNVHVGYLHLDQLNRFPARKFYPVDIPEHSPSLVLKFPPDVQWSETPIVLRYSTHSTPPIMGIT